MKGDIVLWLLSATTNSIYMGEQAVAEKCIRGCDLSVIMARAFYCQHRCFCLWRFFSRGHVHSIDIYYLMNLLSGAFLTVVLTITNALLNY